ncbi:hypothetical protein APR41_17765 [Salegentibacter salinarum]|uniref:Uncharacterized protein n=1 Tax=Salegentibacter salinarum TaxID=447422 RepID=A0A2N0TV83_9FLAO|nr:hypothetical protein [Salegentibacter salinarum]PKD18644.1 hypothetical protein APR41_17765 [Salegentibacter salinarum]SKB98908.1 hypothetical protein SAMN05660903_03661 [Salegentibacter salinarum]
MKNHLSLITCLLLIFSSCTIEDEFTELTSHEDILVETRIFFKDTLVDYDIGFEYYKTDGYNNLISRYISFSGSTNNGRETFSQVFKEYRKAGIKVEAAENVDFITITFTEVNWDSQPYFYYRHDSPGEFTFMYDFESDTYEVTED